jgi:hypothetical protein
MEKPVIRTTEAVFDILGISPGSRIVVEAVKIEDGKPRLTSIELRALLDRDHPSCNNVIPNGRGLMSIPDRVGQNDLPMVAIDLNARNRLGITAGSAVYIRPAISSAFAGEITGITAVTLTAMLSAAALQNITIALFIAAFYTALLLVVLLNRFK